MQWKNYWNKLKNMRRIKYHKVLNFVLISFFLLAIISFLISYTFNVDFVEKYIDEDNRVGEHVKSRITLFQNQMFYLSLFFCFIGFLLLFLKKKVLKFLSTYPEFLTNSFFLLILLMILFLFGEGFMRTFFSEMIYKEYAHGPGSTQYLNKLESNSLGYKDIEHNLVKDENIFRILFLGDSLTRGSGIENLKDTYPKLIQEKLNDQYGYNKVETIIFAKSGYSTLDELSILKETGLKFNPDLIIVGYFLNDAEGENSRQGYENMFYSHYTFPYELGNILYSYSFFYYFLESRLNNIVINLGIGKNNIDYTKHLYSDSNPYFKQHKKDLKDMISLSNERGIPIMIVMIPSLDNIKDYPYEEAHFQIKSIIESNKVYFLDLLPYFQKYDVNNIRVSFMDAHMNELGHQIAANTIINYIRENSLLN